MVFFAFLVRGPSERRLSSGYPLKRRCIAEMLAGQTISLASRTGRFRLGEKSTSLAQT